MFSLSQFLRFNPGPCRVPDSHPELLGAVGSGLLLLLFEFHLCEPYLILYEWGEDRAVRLGSRES